MVGNTQELSYLDWCPCGRLKAYAKASDMKLVAMAEAFFPMRELNGMQHPSGLNF